MLFACILPLKRKDVHFRRETFMNWFLFYQKWNQVMSKEYLGTENNPTCFNSHLFGAKRQDAVFKVRPHTFHAAFPKRKGERSIKKLTFIRSPVSLCLNWHESNESWKLERNTLI